MGEAIADIAAERARQISSEGWTPDHDDEHEHGEMAMAAAAYAFASGHPLYEEHWNDTPPPWWKWDRKWWKPKDARRNLVRAGALIVAEIERLDRAQHNRSTPPDAAQGSPSTKDEGAKD